MDEIKLPTTIDEFKIMIGKALKVTDWHNPTRKFKNIKNIQEFYSHEDLAFYLYWYARYVSHKRWEAKGEEYILKSRIIYYLLAYSGKVMKERWYEAEKIVLEEGCPYDCYMYARESIKKRWIEAERYILKDEVWSNCYRKQVLTKKIDKMVFFIKTILYRIKLIYKINYERNKTTYYS